MPAEDLCLMVTALSSTTPSPLPLSVLFALFVLFV
jgi:hypothetical protein